jgi:hypothetical protein
MRKQGDAHLAVWWFLEAMSTARGDNSGPNRVEETHLLCPSRHVNRKHRKWHITKEEYTNRSYNIRMRGNGMNTFAIHENFYKRAWRKDIPHTTITPNASAALLSSEVLSIFKNEQVKPKRPTQIAF